MRYLYTGVLIVGALAMVMVGCNRNKSVRESLTQTTRGMQQGPRILADYQPWFGDPEHMEVGYSTQDPAILRKQVQRAKQMGIYAFAVDWYGERRPFEDRSYALLQQVSAEERFHICLMYDETQEDNGHATEDALQAFEKAYRAYIGPHAPAREAYVTFNGRPIIFIFPKRGNTDWNRVRAAVDQWERPPILIYKDDPPAKYLSAFDGFYAWVHPGQHWDPDGRDWGKEYLDRFYKKMSERTDKVIVGGIWPGFNDTKASWSLNRHMDRRCGATFEDTLKLFHHYNDPVRPMPFLLIATWNDYEEGTQIENGISNCHGNRPITEAAER
ncbi:MAG TPA: endo-1,3-alpha-glucanase family glycosylhydrolase [Terriglobales bacterium]|nr:endo-1,3-alpha-glucanase family glycosylhydrolase [Terriglobales bacterium]